jgi:hypothetical protein
MGYVSVIREAKKERRNQPHFYQQLISHRLLGIED